MSREVDSARKDRQPLLGAAFLMATSAIGPGFLTQTAFFTEQYKASFAFIILITVVCSLVVQLNIWRIIGVSGLRGQELADRVLPGLGTAVTALVVLGGLVFNLGNLGGAGLGLNVMFGADVRVGAVVTAGIAIGVFLVREMGKALDAFSKALGALMILMVAYVVVVTRPPLAEAALRAVYPAEFDFLPAVTLLGGTVGGYITFSGAHRLLDAGVKGAESLPQISRSAVMGILIATLMRVLLFLAVLGVVAKGTALDAANPPASAFAAGAGQLGYKLFGVVLWSAAVTSVVGSAYTSISFLKTRLAVVSRRVPHFTAGFIVVSMAIFLMIGRPVELLIVAGSLNGLILPVTLGSALLATSTLKATQGYRHPTWLLVTGWLAVVVAGVAGYQSLRAIGGIWK